MSRTTVDGFCDLAPLQGRKTVEDLFGREPPPEMYWTDTGFFLGGEITRPSPGSGAQIVLEATYQPRADATDPGVWIELETSAHPITILDLILVGTRPLPRENITCVCRHPNDGGLLLAATDDARLLVMEADLRANLKVGADLGIPAGLRSLVCCGSGLLGLEHGGRRLWQFGAVPPRGESLLLPAAVGQEIPVQLSCLAENDRESVWGLSPAGDIVGIELTEGRWAIDPVRNSGIHSTAGAPRLRKTWWKALNIEAWLKSLYKANRDHLPLRQYLQPHRFIPAGLAFDGRHFWSCSQGGQVLRMYDRDGHLHKIFPTWPEAAVTNLSYRHRHLLVLDREHQLLHEYYLADNLEPAAAAAGPRRHPGFLPAGSPRCAGIHDLCLLYVGGVEKLSIYRYDLETLRPLVGYVDQGGIWQDSFMDGFLLLAQYSPLLNGRVFSADLRGEPARQEDWLALFDEYFHPQANLAALDESVGQLHKTLDKPKASPLKVVLGVPSAGPCCRAWGGPGHEQGTSLDGLEVTRWAMQQLVLRWTQADFNHLELAGFYYMSEQGSWDDLMIQNFPALCRAWGLHSFAIPGITSTWLTEFCRAGFDCVVMQSSHAFWQPFRRPRHQALKTAGHIAREFGMGMEVELPYAATSAAGIERIRDYLRMASIQGWAGAFKAYFQSFSLMKDLAESPDPSARGIYDDLYRMSGAARQDHGGEEAGEALPLTMTWPPPGSSGGKAATFRLDCQPHQGRLVVTRVEAR